MSEITKESLDQIFEGTGKKLDGYNTDDVINRAVNGVDSFSAAGDDRITPVKESPSLGGYPEDFIDKMLNHRKTPTQRRVNLDANNNPFFPWTSPIPTGLPTTGPGFIPNPHVSDPVINKIKEILTVKEFEILMYTNYRSSVVQIRQYCDIIDKLLENQVFEGDYHV